MFDNSIGFSLFPEEWKKIFLEYIAIYACCNFRCNIFATGGSQQLRDSLTKPRQYLYVTFAIIRKLAQRLKPRNARQDRSVEKSERVAKINREEFIFHPRKT